MDSDRLLLLLYQTLGGLALLVLFFLGASLIRSFGRRVRPRPPAPPSDTTDLWAQYRLPQEPPTGDKP